MKIRLTRKGQMPFKPEFNRKVIVLRAFLLSAVIFSGLISTGLNAQNQKVSISQENTTLKNVLQLIEKQTNYLFVYSPDELNLEKQVSLDMKNTSVKDVLSDILRGQNVKFYQEGNNIVLQRIKQQDIRKKHISGTVMDESGEALVGASVALKGTTTGTMTDIDGKYTLEVPEGSTIVVTYVGFISQSVVVTAKSQYDFTLKDGSRELEAVVVTALGIKRAEKALSYNVQSVSQDDITTIKDANFINSLSGKVAGVNINASSSGIGGASKVVMRGTKSILQSSNALYVIDGVPMYSMNNDGGTEFSSSGTTESIADINPEDIESMSVLTGAAAAALYGSDAANGAIVMEQEVYC